MKRTLVEALSILLLALILSLLYNELSPHRIKLFLPGKTVAEKMSSVE